MPRLILRWLRPAIQLAAAALLAFVLVRWLGRNAPYEMDEYASYQPIACLHFAQARANPDAVRTICQVIWLRLPFLGLRLPLRAFDYSGSLAALLYYPLYLLWKHPDSARLMGLVYLSVDALLLGRLMRRPWWQPALALLAYFPYAIQHLSDTGMVGPQCAVFFALVLTLRAWLRDQRMRQALLLAVLTFVGVWVKLSFLWFFPGLCLYALTEICQTPSVSRTVTGSVVEAKGRRRTLLRQAMLAAVLLTLLLGTLFGSRIEADPGKPQPVYLMELRRAQRHEEAPIWQIAADPRWWRQRLLRTWINPYEGGQRLFRPQRPHTPFIILYNGFWWVLLPLLAVTLGEVGRGPGRRRAAIAAAVAAYFMTVVVILSTVTAWGVHHSILSQVWLILALALALGDEGDRPGLVEAERYRSRRRQRWLMGLLLVFLLINLRVWWGFSRQPFQEPNDLSKPAILALLDDTSLSQAYVYGVIDWGIYSLQALYGPPSQLVIHHSPLVKSRQVEAMRAAADGLGRKLLIVYDAKVVESDLTLLRGKVQLQACNGQPATSRWRVLLEPNTGLRHPCFAEP